jgi:hypothetical protein
VKEEYMAEQQSTQHGAIDAELVKSTNEFLVRAGDGAVAERAADIAQRQEVRGDYERRQEWNGLIEGGSVSVNGQERSVQDLKPPVELTKQEIVSEARELHAHFQQLMDRFDQAPAGQKAEIREEMKPVVTRDNELREEYTGRVKAELSQDRVPEQNIGFAR